MHQDVAMTVVTASGGSMVSLGNVVVVAPAAVVAASLPWGCLRFRLTLKLVFAKRAPCSERSRVPSNVYPSYLNLIDVHPQTKSTTGNLKGRLIPTPSPYCCCLPQKLDASQQPWRENDLLLLEFCTGSHNRGRFSRLMAFLPFWTTEDASEVQPTNTRHCLIASAMVQSWMDVAGGRLCGRLVVGTDGGGEGMLALKVFGEFTVKEKLFFFFHNIPLNTQCGPNRKKVPPRLNPLQVVMSF